MVVHDLRNPADAIKEGLKQADLIMEMGFNEMFEMTNAHFAALLKDSSSGSSIKDSSSGKEEVVSYIRRRMLLAKWNSKKQLSQMKETQVQNKELIGQNKVASELRP